MQAYYINIPGYAGPMTFLGHDEKSVRKTARNALGYGKRLPKGTKVYQKFA